MKKYIRIALASASLLIALNPAHSKTYEGKECRKDYKRLCPGTPIGKCDLAKMTDKLSAPCKKFVETH